MSRKGFAEVERKALNGPLGGGDCEVGGATGNSCVPASLCGTIRKKSRRRVEFLFKGGGKAIHVLERRSVPGETGRKGCVG